MKWLILLMKVSRSMYFEAVYVYIFYCYTFGLTYFFAWFVYIYAIYSFINKFLRCLKTGFLFCTGIITVSYYICIMSIKWLFLSSHFPLMFQVAARVAALMLDDSAAWPSRTLPSTFSWKPPKFFKYKED